MFGRLGQVADDAPEIIHLLPQENGQGRATAAVIRGEHEALREIAENGPPFRLERVALMARAAFPQRRVTG